MSASSQSRAVATLVIIACVAGCASVAPERGPARAPRALAMTTGALRDVIDVDEIAVLRGASALDAVRRLRPEWLARRAVDGSPRAMPVLYIDGARSGDARMLADVRAESVRAIRYYSPNEAKTRFGRWDDAGVLSVLLAR